MISKHYFEDTFSLTTAQSLQAWANKNLITVTTWDIVTNVTMSGLSAAMSSITKDTKFIIDDETYTSTISIGGNGTNKVWVIAKNQQGVISQNLTTIAGDNIILEGFKFNGGTVKFGQALTVEGDDCKVTRCLWDDSQWSHWLRLAPYSHRCEVSYCTFQNKTSNATLNTFGQVLGLWRDISDTTPDEQYVHYNYFYNIPHHNLGNGGEVIQTWVDNTSDQGPFGVDTLNIVENNLFVKCNGEAELISNKSNGFTVRRNTFKDSTAGYTQRIGERNIVEDNYFLNINQKGASIRVFRNNNTVRRNYIDGNTAGAGIELSNGNNSNFGAANNAIITDNIIMNCNSGIRLGRDVSPPDNFLPNNIVVTGNSFENCAPNGAFRIVGDTAAVGATFSNNTVEGTLGSNPGGLTLAPITIPSNALDGVLSVSDVGINA